MPGFEVISERDYMRLDAVVLKNAGGRVGDYFINRSDFEVDGRGIWG